MKACKLKPIVVLTANRSPLLPDVTTAAESGYPQVVVAPWFGIGGPAGTPLEIVRRVHEALFRGLQTKEVGERFTAIGATVHPSKSPEEFVAYIRTEHARWGEVIKSAGVKIE